MRPDYIATRGGVKCIHRNLSGRGGSEYALHCDAGAIVAGEVGGGRRAAAKAPPAGQGGAVKGSVQQNVREGSRRMSYFCRRQGQEREQYKVKRQRASQGMSPIAGDNAGGSVSLRATNHEKD